MQAFDTETILITVIHNACNTNSNERTELHCFVHTVNIYQAKHKPSTTSTVENFELPTIPKGKCAYRLYRLGR